VARINPHTMTVERRQKRCNASFTSVYHAKGRQVVVGVLYVPSCLKGKTFVLKAETVNIYDK